MFRYESMYEQVSMVITEAGFNIAPIIKPNIIIIQYTHHPIWTNIRAFQFLQTILKYNYKNILLNIINEPNIIRDPDNILIPYRILKTKVTMLL